MVQNKEARLWPTGYISLHACHGMETDSGLLRLYYCFWRRWYWKLMARFHCMLYKTDM